MQRFSDYISEVKIDLDRPPTVNGVKAQFTAAIIRHSNLPTRERIASTRDASAKVAAFYGTTDSGRTRPLFTTNDKTDKAQFGGKKGSPLILPDGRGVSTLVLALSPAYKEGKFTTCPRSQSCEDHCIASGKGGSSQYYMAARRPGDDMEKYQGPLGSALGRTHMLLHDTDAFARRAYDEIRAHIATSELEGNIPAVRFNGFSDLDVHEELVRRLPEASFYDYTKLNRNKFALDNHHLTYSSTGLSQPNVGVTNPNQNWREMRTRLHGGDNVAMVFSHKTQLPETVRDHETGDEFRVIDGTKHDYRPADQQPEGSRGVVVGLKNRSTNKKNESAAVETNGFMIHYDPENKKTARGNLERGDNGLPIPTVTHVDIARQDK